MFSVHGSSGSNWIVLRMLALERSDALVLVARNIHHSVINALKAFGLDFRFLPTPYDSRFEALLPPSVEEVARRPAALSRGARRPLHVADLRGARRQHARDRRRRPRWRPTTRWSSSTRRGAGTCASTTSCRSSAMQAGADVCVQSTHKLAGGLQQTGLIHWRTDRVDSELMEEAYREYVTTSPSYHLLGSADAAVRTLAARRRAGARRVDRRARGGSRRELRERLPDLDQLDEPAWLDEMADHVAGHDLVKTTVGLTRYALTGYDVAEALVERADRHREGRRATRSR